MSSQTSNSPQKSAFTKWAAPIFTLVCTVFLSVLVYNHSDWKQTPYASKSVEASKDMRLLIDRTASPDFLWRTQDTTKHQVSKLAGQVIYFNFWASWCPPCREEIPLLVQLANEFKGQPLKIVFVNMDRDPENMEEAQQLAQNLIPKELSTFEPMSFRNHLNIELLPYHIFIDKQGRVAGEFYGDVLSLKPEMAQLFQQLLKEQN